VQDVRQVLTQHGHVLIQRVVGWFGEKRAETVGGTPVGLDQLSIGGIRWGCHGSSDLLWPAPGRTPLRGSTSVQVAVTSLAEIKEAIGGYLLFEADDLDAAIELAARIPAARLGGAVEVRPIVEW
jgi:hypothetical protein